MRHMRFWPYSDEILSGQDRLLLEVRAATGLLRALLHNQGTIMSALTDLQAADAKLGTSIANAVAKLNTDTSQLADLAAQIASGGGDPAALAALASDISTRADALDAAVNPAPSPSPAPAPAPTPATPVTSDPSAGPAS
jgi:hypothetical protein